MTRMGFLVRYLRCDTGRDRVLPTASEALVAVPLRLFATRAGADAYCAELHRQARRTINPFTALPFLSGRTEGCSAMVRSLRALPVPFTTLPFRESGWVDYRDWYDAEAAHLSDADRAAVWGCFDSTLYDVAEATWDE